jgi:small subunit ribosomal protein S1
MLAKIRKFYATFDDKGIAAIYPGRTVQARIINVTEKRLRVEIFGIEVGIRTTDLCWEWIGDLRDKPEYQVGNTILVKIKDVEYPTGSRTGNWYENIKVSAEARSLTPDVREENFEKIHVQGIYSGEITEIHDNTYYIHLASGVNAVAHEVAGTAIPMIKDKIVFVCTRKNVDNCVAVGIITRVIQTAFTR